MTWLVVGLGNPGREHRHNRHNVGFMTVERLVERSKAGAWKEKFKGQWAKGSIGRDEVVLLEPMTYMNLSGESVQAAMAFFKIPLASVIVIHDELDLAWRNVRVKVGGGAAGHNGIKSVTQHCGADFVRIRIGVGKPARGSTESWVLGDFDAIESAELPDVLETASLAAESVVKDGPQAAQNRFNTRPTAR